MTTFTARKFNDRVVLSPIDTKMKASNYYGRRERGDNKK